MIFNKVVVPADDDTGPKEIVTEWCGHPWENLTTPTTYTRGRIHHVMSEREAQHVEEVRRLDERATRSREQLNAAYASATTSTQEAWDYILAHKDYGDSGWDIPNAEMLTGLDAIMRRGRG